MYCRFAPEAAPLEATPVDNLFILEHLPAASGTQLRVYLYGLMLCRYPSFDASTMRDVLALTQEEMVNAFAYWQRQGLVRIKCADPLDVEYLPPAKRADGQMLLPGKYASLIQALQSLLAPRTLRTAELRRVYDWIEVFGLEEPAVLEMVSHCLESRGPRVGISYMDTVARAWADAGVRTAEDAKAYADQYTAKTGGAAAVLKRWRMYRQPTEDELALYQKWTNDQGFSLEAVLAACAAMTKAERPSFKYLDGILDRLYQAGTLEAEEITAKFGMDDADAAFARKIFQQMGLRRSARSAELEQLAAFRDSGLPLEVMLFAAEQAQLRERPFVFLKKVLADYQAQGIRSIAQAQEHQKRHEGTYARKKTPDALKYSQKKYTKEDLQHIFVNAEDL